MDKDCWDKLFTQKLQELGLEWEVARKVVGLVAEERMEADRLGYIRGYNHGHKSGLNKANRDEN